MKSKKKPTKAPLKAVRGYQKHGLTTIIKAVKHKGIPVIDQRTRLAIWIKKQRRELFADLGGEESLSSQQRRLVDDVVKRLVIIETLDNWIFRQTSVINGRTRSLHPLVLQRMTVADGMVRCLEKLGLERKAKAIPDLQTYINQGSPQS